jgi:phosphopantothenoylcysteine decarboxylase/phosphopantothenate--cysteine ligase
MRILLTAGPTREPIDPVRYLGNRSSGKMGAAVVEAGLAAGHSITAILGPGVVPFPTDVRRRDVETAAEMYAAVMAEWPQHDLLIMAAAVADYRPKVVSLVKMSRAAGALALELVPTADIAASACKARHINQRVVGFSLEREGDVERALNKMRTKGLDMVVFNPLPTMGATDVEALLLWPDGRQERADLRAKGDFARLLVDRAAALFGHG